MSGISLVTPSFEHILSLGESCTRIRKSKFALHTPWHRKVVLFFRDLFYGGCPVTDRAEYRRYSALINREVTWLKDHQSTPNDEFFTRLKVLLHVKAKFDFTGWSKSLQNGSDFKEFTEGLAKLKAHAITTVDQWVNDSTTALSKREKHSIRRWVEADELQLQFAGYSNEIVYKAEEIPVGAVLLNNHPAYLVSNRLRGFKKTIMQRIKGIRNVVCRIFTGLPLIHTVAALGGGRFIHVAKDNESTGKRIGVCVGRPEIEDFSDEARTKAGKKPKYMFGYDVMLPNHQRFSDVLGIPRDQVETFLKNEWKPLLEASTKHPLTSFWNMVGTICNSTRPSTYNIRTVYQEKPGKGYSCSGLVSAVFARFGLDPVEKCKKRVEKAAPADFVRSNLFDIGFANNRGMLEGYRKRYVTAAEENTVFNDA